MKALYIALGFALFLGVVYGTPAVQFACVAAGLGWVVSEDKKAKEARR